MVSAEPVRLAIVTGAAGGIGAAVARALTADGFFVACLDRDIAGAQTVAEEVGGTALEADVADASVVDRVVLKLASGWGPPAVLVNVAGIADQALLVDSDPDMFERLIATNLRGTFLMLRAAGRAMVAGGEGGAVVSVSSIGAEHPTPGLGLYEMTKAGVNALTRSAAVELAPHGIRVNAVAPGPVLTPMTAPAFEEDRAEMAEWLARIPGRRFAEAEDVAPMVAMLCSTGAAHITGAIIPIDGGQLIG